MQNQKTIDPPWTTHPHAHHTQKSTDNEQICQDNEPTFPRIPVPSDYQRLPAGCALTYKRFSPCCNRNEAQVEICAQKQAREDSSRARDPTSKSWDQPCCIHRRKCVAIPQKLAPKPVSPFQTKNKKRQRTAGAGLNFARSRLDYLCRMDVTPRNCEAAVVICAELTLRARCHYGNFRAGHFTQNYERVAGDKMSLGQFHAEKKRKERVVNTRHIQS